jgi:hypothetical protein
VGLLDALAPVSDVRVSSTQEYTVHLTLNDSDQALAIFTSPLRQLLIVRRDAAFRVEHQHRLKGIIIATSEYHRIYGMLPPARAGDGAKGFDENGNPYLSWRVHILPMLGYAELFKKFCVNEPWDSPHNAALINEMPDHYRVRGVRQPGHTSFMTFSGRGTPFPPGGGVSLEQLPNFGARTIFAVQASPAKAVPWTKPIDLPLNPANPLEALGNVGPLFIAAYFDGGSRQVRSEIPPDVLLRMITIPTQQ